MSAPAMSRLLLSLLAGAFLGAAVPSAADQDDARLEPLFERLRTAANAALADDVEGEIWRIWLQSGDEDLNRLLAEGMRAMQVGDSERALAIFDRVVARAPGFAEGWNKRATVHWLRNEYSDSMRDIQQTLRLEPRHFGALSGMGLIFDELEDPEGALRAFEAVLRIHPHARGARERVEALRQELQNRIL